MMRITGDLFLGSSKLELVENHVFHEKWWTRVVGVA